MDTNTAMTRSDAADFRSKKVGTIPLSGGRTVQITAPRNIHEVKSWTHLFAELISGRKKHDIHDMTERDYKVGDLMILNEFDMATGKYTGRCAEVEITYITDRSTPCALSSIVLDRNHGILSVEVRDVFDREGA